MFIYFTPLYRTILGFDKKSRKVPLCAVLQKDNNKKTVDKFRKKIEQKMTALINIAMLERKNRKFKKSQCNCFFLDFQTPLFIKRNSHF